MSDSSDCNCEQSLRLQRALDAYVTATVQTKIQLQKYAEIARYADHTPTCRRMREQCPPGKTCYCGLDKLMEDL